MTHDDRKPAASHGFAHQLTSSNSPDSRPDSERKYRGYVLDATGGAVGKAEVNAQDALGGEKRTVKTGPNGAYRIENITPSTYTLSVTAPGFSRKDITGINVTASTVTLENVTLEVGATQQVVEVSAGTALIQTDSGELSQTVSTVQIEKLPISSLNPIDLVPHAAGGLDHRQP